MNRPLSPERWQEVCEIFADALQEPPEARIDFLDHRCDDDLLRHEVLSLLRAHEEAGETFIERPFADPLGKHTSSGRESQDLRESPVLEAVGPYRLEALLGRGGMGSVYLARRADAAFEKKVAIKILRRDLVSGLASESPDALSQDLARRFRSERQILARLEHPYIARLLDGGTCEDGRPFLVMEYIRGRPIDRECARRGSGVDDRLELFCKVASAVAFAHRSLIVHRDLKPANILVGEDGEPRLLDFGIAKLLEADALPLTVIATQPGISPMTLACASPEQIQGEAVTTATDIYSLGVLLYLLLAGHSPYDIDPGDLRALSRAICEVDPPSPSAALAVPGASSSCLPPNLSAADRRRWRIRLAGDLDAIARHALRKEPERRYSTVEQLVDDIQRHRRGLPVRARRDSFSYRAGKFLRRHGWGVAAAAALLALSLGFVITLLIQNERVQRQRRSAQEVADMMIGLFHGANPEGNGGAEDSKGQRRLLGERLTARELLKRGARRMRGRLADEPEVRSDLLIAIGRSYKALGLVEESIPFLEEALELRRSHLGRAHPAVAESLRWLGSGELERGDSTAAAAYLQEALTTLPEAPSRERVAALTTLGHTLALRGHLQGAEDLHRQAVEVARGLDGDRPSLASSFAGLAGILQERGKLTESETAYGEALRLYREAFGEHHPRVVGTLQSLAFLHSQREDFERAEEEFRAALEIQRALYEGPHPSLASTLDNLASSLYDGGRYRESEALATEALAMRRQIYGGEHSKVARSLNLLALLRWEQGDLETAEARFREAIDIWQRQPDGEGDEVASGLANLAAVLMTRGRLEDAEDLYRRALDLTRKVYGETHSRVGVLLYSLARVVRNRGDLEGAESLNLQAIGILREGEGAESELATATQNLAVVLKEKGDLQAAEARFREALALLRRQVGDTHPYIGVTLKNLADTLCQRGDHGAAEIEARLALEVLAASFEAEHPWVLTARGVLGTSLQGQGRFAEAESELLASYRGLIASEGGADVSFTARARERLRDLYRAWGRPEAAAAYR